MRAELLQLAADLTRKGESFAMATVVRREAASSAQVGNAALITAAGDCHGWLGGSCLHATVVREAAAALAAGTPRLISLSPDPANERRPGVTAFPLTCHSGGSVDIYIEPQVPAPRLLIFGVSPAAQALAALAKVMGYTVEEIDPGADRIAEPRNPEDLARRPAAPRSRLFAVVASLGQGDEEAILTALAAEPAYLGVVASRKRFSQIRETLAAHGATTQALDAIVNPAGIDIGARSPEEVALSVLAEIVKVRHAADERAAVANAPAAREAIDPVCGMTVMIDGARHRAEHAGRTFYFCCSGCRQRFLAAPEHHTADVVT